MRRYKRADHYSASKIQAVVRRALNKNIETKTGLQTISDGTEISHNNFVLMGNNPLATVQGLKDEENDTGNRIGNKMIDTLNRERFTFLHTKTFKIKAPNGSMFGSNYSPVIGGSSGIQYEATVTQQMSRATKIVKVWIDGKKFSRSGVIQYEDNSTQVKFFDYHLILYAYSNYSTNQDVWNVARLNDCVVQLYYKDA